MKRTFLSLAVLAMAAFSSCETPEALEMMPTNPLAKQLVGNWAVSSEYSKDYQETYGSDKDFAAIWADHIIKTLVIKNDKTYSVIGPDGKLLPGGNWAITADNKLSFTSESAADLTKQFSARLSAAGELEMEDEHVVLTHQKRN